MDIITVIVIGLAIYSLFEKVIRKSQPDKPMTREKMLSERDFKLTSIREIFNQWIESQNPKQVLELEQFPERNFSSHKDDSVFETAESPQSFHFSGSLGGVSTEGEQGVEGLPGVEGTQGIEGTSGEEGTSGIEGNFGIGTPGREGIYRTEGTLQPGGNQGGTDESCKEGQFGFLNLALPLRERELVQGIVWAEVLGRPRALRPFRSSR
ncbi:MAG: hypothetical protein ACYDEJ_11795 [Desulfitobacteriaceae bacterium]